MRIIGKKRLTFQNLFDIILSLSTTQRKEKSVMAETAKKAVNYTDELTAKVISDYQEGVELDAIADEIGKSVRSVRSKLVREGVYVAKPKTASAKREEPTKRNFSISWKALPHLRLMVSWVQPRLHSMICFCILRQSNNSFVCERTNKNNSLTFF